MLFRSLVSCVVAVDIHYQGLEPTGTAWLTVTSGGLTSHVVKKFYEGIYLGAFRVAAAADTRSSGNFSNRGRGQEGRREAAERGVVGSGPSGKLPSGGSRSVAISGLPTSLGVQDMRNFLKRFKFAGDTSESKEVIKLAMSVTS